MFSVRDEQSVSRRQSSQQERRGGVGKVEGRIGASPAI